MSCGSCLHKFDSPSGPLCQVAPPVLVSSRYHGPKDSTREHYADPANWDMIWALPPAVTRCKEYVQQVHGL